LPTYHEPASGVVAAEGQRGDVFVAQRAAFSHEALELHRADCSARCTEIASATSRVRCAAA
jgi:hypothetical protein